MAADSNHDQTTVYANEHGEELTFAQIAMAAAKERDITVEETEDGYLFNGDLYTPVDSGGDT